MKALLTINNVKKYIEQNGDVNITDSEGRNMLFKDFNSENELDIIVSYTADIVGILIESGINVNHKSYDGSTALFGVENEEIGMLLIDNGIDIHVKNNKQLNAMTSNQNSRIEALLFDKNADILAKTIYGEHLFLKTKNIELMKKYIEQGGNIQTEIKGLNAIYYSLGNTHKLKFCLAAGVEVNKEEQIFELIVYSKSHELKILLDSGLDILKQRDAEKFIRFSENYIDEEDDDISKKLYQLIKKGAEYEQFRNLKRMPPVIARLEKELLEQNIEHDHSLPGKRL